MQHYRLPFRPYRPQTGAFMSADPYDGSMDLGDPQSMNRYAYVLDNPSNGTDPLGLDATCSNVNGVLTCVVVSTAEPPPPENPWWNYEGPIIPDYPLFPFALNIDLNFNGGIPGFDKGPTNPTTLSPKAQGCQAKIQNAVNNALHTSTVPLGPTQGPGMSPDGYRNGAYNFNYFAPGVTNPVAGSVSGTGRFPGSGLHIPLPGGADPVIPNWGPGAYNGQSGSYLTAHIDSANPLDDLFSLFKHFFRDVLLRRPHGC